MDLSIGIIRKLKIFLQSEKALKYQRFYDKIIAVNLLSAYVIIKNIKIVFDGFQARFERSHRI
jgi:hypothetical protein